MAFYLFSLILCLLDSIYSTQNKSTISQYNLPFEIEGLNLSNKLNKKNKINYLNENNDDPIKNSLIEFIKNISILNESELYISIFNYSNNITKICRFIFYLNNRIFICDIMEDFFNKSNSTLLNESINIITNKTNNVSENIIHLLNSTTKLNGTFIVSHLKYIFRVDEVFVFYKNLYDRYGKYLINVTEMIVNGLNNEYLSTIFDILKDFFDRYKKDLYIFLYDMVKYNGQRENILITISEFINENTMENKTIFQDFKKIIDDKNKAKKLIDAFFELNIMSPIGINLIKEMLSNTKLMDFLFQMIYDNFFVDSVIEIIKNLYNEKYLKTLIRIFCDIYIVNNQTNLDLFWDFLKTAGKNLVEKEEFVEIFSLGASNTIKEFLIHYVDNRTNVSSDCINLFRDVFINNNLKDDETNDSHSNLFFVKKLIFESSLNKNDFLNYENCLSSNKTFSNLTQNQIDVKPVYIVSMIEESYNKTLFRNSMFYEKYNYLQTLCVPQGKNTSTNEVICSEKDYKYFIEVYTKISFNIKNATIETKILDNQSINIKRKDRVLSIAILIILNFPLFVKLFLFIFLLIYKRVKMNTKNEIFNKLTKEEDKKDDNNQEEEKVIKYENNNNQLENPKCYQILNRYFDLIDNLKEFYNTISNFFYIFIFVGLRYAPRLIFSCSGYTLTYKFLSFIEHDSDFCFLKFLFFQSYKYILLILMSIFMRYTLYYINIAFHSIKNPVYELLNLTIDRYNKNYFYNLFFLLFYNLNQNEFESTKSIIQFLYLPINEVFLFIFGISLISLGYKFKIRIDIIIIAIILAVLLIKLIFFSIYLEEEKLYPTLYFYSFGFGSLMLNPLYNLPCFLIGMFFGLVNFTIHRGANINGYSKVELLNVSRRSNLDCGDKKRESLVNSNKSLQSDNYKNISNNKNDEDSKRNSISENKELSNKINESFENNRISNTETHSLNLGEGFNEQSKTEIIQKMPFLKLPIILTNFHKRIQNEIKYIIIIAIPCLILLILFIATRFMIIGTFIKESVKDDNKKFIEKLSLKDIITNKFLNIIYLIDLEFFVLIINWIFFYFYYRGGQINDFFSHNYWNFFIKSYFSYALVSGPIILYMFYADETIIKVSILNVILYSLINIIFVFFFTIIFYTYYEYPFRKLIKDLKERKKTNEVIEDDDDCNRENDDFSILA